MTILLINLNWTAITAISEIALASIAMLTLAFNMYLIRKQEKERHEENRARISCSVINDNDGLFIIKIENTGKEAARDIRLEVTGTPIEDNPDEVIRERFSNLAERSFSLQGGQCLFLSISPLRHGHYAQNDLNRITSWVNAHASEKVFIKGCYNNGKYKIDEVLSYNDISVAGSFVDYPQNKTERVLTDIWLTLHNGFRTVLFWHNNENQS